MFNDEYKALIDKYFDLTGKSAVDESHPLAISTKEFRNWTKSFSGVIYELPEFMEDLVKTFMEHDFTIKKHLKTKLEFEFQAEFSLFNKPELEKCNPPELEFNLLEKSILRDVKIDPPIYNPPPIISNKLDFLVIAPIRKKRTTFTIYQNEIEILKTRSIQEVIDKKNDLFTEFSEQNQESLNNKEESLAEILEIKQQYIQTIELLKANISDYLSSTPQLKKIEDLNIEVRELPLEKKINASPSKYKPSYDERSNTLILYEHHDRGKAHANSSIRVHESGALIVFVNTFQRYSKARKYHNSQAYFFFPYLRRFYTRNARLVKDLGDVHDWEISFFNSFGYEEFIPPPKKLPRPKPKPKVQDLYEKCYVCNRPLHFPSIPVRALDRGIWTYLMKPCCACYERMMIDEEFKEKAIIRAHNKIKKLQSLL